MVLGTLPDLPTSDVLVGRVTVRLLREGPAGLPAALADVVAGTGARGVVLRSADPSHELLATAGEVVQVVAPRRRVAVRTFELTVRGPDGRSVGELTVTGAPPRALLPLRDVCAALGLLLAAHDRPACSLPDVEAERSALADALHDGPVQDLVAARYAADAAVRAGADPAVREAVQEALVHLRRVLWQLRPRGADGVADALRRLSAQLVERGAPALVLRIEPAADVLPLPAAVAAYRLVQAVAADPASRDRVVVRLVRQSAPGGREVLALSVDGGVPLRDPARWRRTAAALGGDLLSCPGRLRLVLPAGSGTAGSGTAGSGTAGAGTAGAGPAGAGPAGGGLAPPPEPAPVPTGAPGPATSTTSPVPGRPPNLKAAP